MFAPASAAGLRLPGAEPFSVGDHLGLTIVFGGLMLPLYLALVALASGGLAGDFFIERSRSGFLSVDGRVTFEAGPDGRLRIVGDDRDDYPSPGIYQYLPGGETIVVDRMDEEGVF